MHSESRDGAKVRVLAVHTTEGMMRAKDLRNWTAWAGSSHASADETGVLMTPADGFVDYSLAAWTLRSGNHWSENIELCAWARYTRAEWLARPKLLEACAKWLADRSKARGIPLVKLTPAQYRAGRSGVIGHVDHTVGYADGTHTDPGPNFPYDVVLARAKQLVSAPTTTTPEDDMPLTGDDAQTIWRTPQLEGYGVPILVLRDIAAQAAALRQQVAGLQAALNTLAGAVAAGRDDLTADELRTVIREEMAKVVDVQVSVRDTPTA